MPTNIGAKMNNEEEIEMADKIKEELNKEL